MREIQASKAKTHFSSLLDDVERGETIVITRHGKVIAQLEPTKDIDRARVREVMEGLTALKAELSKTMRPLTVEEILAMRHEGHKY